MGPKTKKLVKRLEETVDLLRSHGEERWAQWLSEDAARLRSGDSYGVTHLLSAYGGMGSLNDLIICPENGHRIKKKDVKRVNKRFQALKSEVYDLANQVKREAVFD
jgi:hypothetical protein